MVFYLLLDGSESSALVQNEKIRDERNSIYLQILKELVDTLISRNKEIYLEVYWGTPFVSDRQWQTTQCYQRLKRR